MYTHLLSSHSFGDSSYIGIVSDLCVRSYSFWDNSYIGIVSDLCVQSDEFLQFRGQLVHRYSQ